LPLKKENIIGRQSNQAEKYRKTQNRFEGKECRKG